MPPVFRTLNALATKDHGNRRCLALGQFAVFNVEAMVNAVQRAVVSNRPK